MRTPAQPKSAETSRAPRPAAARPAAVRAAGERPRAGTPLANAEAVEPQASTRDRLEAALTSPPAAELREAAMAEPEVNDAAESELADAAESELADAAESEQPLTLRDRIELRATAEPDAEPVPARAPDPATASEAAAAPTAEPVAAPMPAAATVPAPVERSAELAVAEQAGELDAEASAGPGGGRSFSRQLIIARLRVTPPASAPRSAGVSGAGPGDPGRSAIETAADRTDTRVDDATARAVIARSRGPPPGNPTAAPSPPRGTASGPPLTVQTKLRVSQPGDAFERSADSFATRVVRGDADHRPPAGAAMPRGRKAAGTRVRPAPSTPRPQPTAAIPHAVSDALAAPSAGAPLPASVRARIEPHLGIDLSRVRVREDAHAAAAADALHARAFAAGATIYLAAGSSPHDLELMAHESAHVAQQAGSPLARDTLHRDASDYLPDVSLSDLIPDWILDGVKETVAAIPGYTLLTYITGYDPLTEEPVTVDTQELIETLLTWGPFGPAVGPVLQGIEVLGEIFAFVSEQLSAHNLTLDRLKRDVEEAWDEFSVSNGIAGNVAIVKRKVDRLLADVTAFVESIVDRVLEMVRAVVVDFAEPLLATPEIAPIWNLTKKVIHYDPLRGVDVDAPTAEIIADFLTLIGQEQRLAQMEERGTLQETADWLDTQLATFTGLISQLGTLFSDAWEAIQPQNLPNLLENLESLAGRAFDFVVDVGRFAETVIIQILVIIKDALLGWLSEHAHTIPGFHLITVIIEQNPFTGDEVPRTAENLIRGFITLLPSGEETYNQLAESGVVGSAAERIEGEMTRLGISVAMVSELFHGIWDDLSLDDLLDPIGAFMRILDQFGEPLGRLLEFIVVVIREVIRLILVLMNFPSDLLGSIVSNAVQAIEDIKRDPVGFIKNMLAAVKLGFTLFFDHIGTHLLNGLTAWLFRGLGQIGITLPTDFSFGSILTLVLQVLGLSVDHLWEKLGEHIGPERVALIRGAIGHLQGAWAFIQEVQTEGIGAVWRFLGDQLSGLWDTLLGMARDWIIQTVIARVTAKLITMLDPTGIMAVVNSFIAFFNAVQSAIEYIREILEIVNTYVMTLAQVAAGNIQPGAQMLENGLAAVVPVAIGFLANQVGLGNMPEKIVEIIGQLRGLVDQAIDWLITQALRLGQAALNALGLGRQPEQPAAPAGAANPKQQAETLLQERLATAKSHDEIAAIVAAVRTQLQPSGLSGLELRGPDPEGKYEIHAAASPFTQLVSLVPGLGGPRAVTMNIRLLLHAATPSLEDEPALARNRQAARNPDGSIQLDAGGSPVMETTHFSLPPTIAHGRARRSRSTSGGVALPPAAGATELRLLTYNTSEDPRADSNLSHAERQFEEFLERAPDVARNVAEVHADINWSPCSICAATLVHCARLTPNATRRILNWHDLYTHPVRGTTAASLGRIAAGNAWQVIPASVTGGPTAAEQGVLTAANWATLTT